MDFASVEDFVADIEELPTLPSTVARLIDLLNDENSKAKEIAQVLSSDQTLATKVLRIVNSPFYSLKRTITSVEQAVVILGFSNIRSIVLGASVIETFSANAGEYFKPANFWRHSISTAASAQALAKELEMEKPEDAFTAGLLHMIGLLVLDQYMPEPLRQIEELVEEDSKELIDAEEEILGFDHGKIGAVLLKQWHIPDVICNAVRFYLYPDMDPGDKKLASTILVADCVTRSLGFGYAGDAYVTKIPEIALTSMGLIPEAFEPLMKPIDDAVDRAQVFMKMVS